LPVKATGQKTTMAATGLTSDSLEPQEVTLDSTGAMSDSLEPLEP